MAPRIRNDKPEVSVVIPTFNSANFLPVVLNALAEQTYKNIEVIVVDNYSTDETREIAKRFKAKVFLHGNERASQINYGIEQASGKYIYETGSDLKPDPTYIEEAVKKCKEGYDAIYASVVSFPSRNFWNMVKALERKVFIGDNTIECSHFFKRRLYYFVGKMDERLISVEEDFQHRLDKKGIKTGRISARETHLHESNSLKEVAQKSYYYGMYLRAYLKKYPVRGTRYLFPLRWAYIRRFYLFAREPILTLGFIIYKFTQYSYGAMGLIASRKKQLHKELYGESSTDKPAT